MTLNLSIEEESQLFLENVAREIPSIKERFMWIRKREREMNADDTHIWKNVLGYYIQARNCYCCGLYYPAIALMGSTIELGLKQILLDDYPELYVEIMENWDLRTLGNYIEEVHSRGVISSELKGRIDQYRSKYRNLAAHPQPHMPLTFGGIELSPGSWVCKSLDDILNPEDVAKEGLACFLQLCKEYDNWKRNREDH
jgi:hypothetical protein